MKRIVALLCACFILCLAACGHTESDQPDDTTPTETVGEQANEPEQQNTVRTMEDMVNVDGVTAVTAQSFSQPTEGVVAYKISYETTNGKLVADVVLPNDYADTNYPVLLYFPEIGNINIDALAAYYARYGFIAIRPYARGYNESEGVRDFGGARDLADAQKLLQIFDTADFVADSKVFVAGSSEGSVVALRLFAEDTQNRISGCAVTDVITDVHAFAVARGENVQSLLAALIGNTYEEAPEEYALRSAVTFSEKLAGRPLLLLHYQQNTSFPVEQTDSLYELLQDAGNCTYQKLDIRTSDFNGTGLQTLLVWLRAQI